MIHEVIVTTRNSAGQVHIAPMGIHWRDNRVVISPFKPSTTLENLLKRRDAVINYCDDVRVFAGCLTGHYEWPVQQALKVDVPRLQDALAHSEVRLESIEEDELRPRLLCSVVHDANHRPFRGFNRAQAAVLELAILVSRLERLPRSKIQRELAYLRIAIDKTAGTREHEAWGWLMDRIDGHLGQMEAGQ
ncbi:MAG: DUF447 family protein [Gammaproteobacteria bacterium]|nr:DUF447 family protein [Gammaproteobacteria bacterium]